MNGKQLIEHMILLERNVGLLYNRFGEEFPQDNAFWQKLSSEEIHHASMLETLLEYIVESHELFSVFEQINEETVLAINAKVQELINSNGRYSASRDNALLIALQIEQAAGEAHFQEVAEKNASSVPLSVFQQLNAADRDHASRISRYMGNSPESA